MAADTFQSTWTTAVKQHGDNPFLVFQAESGAQSRWTYAEFDEVVTRTAGALRAAGVSHGSSVHVVLRNCPAFIALWLATSRLGAWLVPVDPGSTARDIASQVQRVQPVVGVYSAHRADVYREGTNGTVPAVMELAEDETDLDESAVLHGDFRAVAEPVTPLDRLAVMFTSGTTSEPKGVVLTQANYAVAAETMASVTDLQARHRWLVTLPLFHANAQYYCFAPAIAVGASVALTATFSASRWVAQARHLDATHASLFAAPIRMILARCSPAEPPLTLEHVWFAQSLGAEHYERFARLVGTRPRQLYGMTETVAIVCADTGETPRHDVIGWPVAGRRIRIEEVGGDSCPPEIPGELKVLGKPGIDLFSGYLDDPATTAKAFRETEEGTWFATGDLLTTNEDGILRFVGRVDDVIKVSGENVSLTEVEATVAQAPGILDVAIVARPDPVRDAVPVAYFVARDPQNPPREPELVEWAALNLPPAARPRQWNLIGELPRTSVGKVRRFRITS